MKSFKLCYTVKGRKYAIALLNSLAIGDVKKPYIFAMDQDAKDVFDKYGVPYRDSYGINIYQDKILNAMTLSNENPEDLIVALDVMLTYDMNDVHDFLKYELKDYVEESEKNIFLISAEYYIPGFRNEINITYTEICGGLSMYYGIKQEQIDEYLKYYNIISNSPDTIVKSYDGDDGDNTHRYRGESLVTEEEIFENIIHRYPVNNLNIIVDFKDSYSPDNFKGEIIQKFHDGYGGEAMKYIIDNHAKNYYNHYFILDKYLAEFWNC